MLLRQFRADFLDEERCRVWVIESLHAHGRRCPSCHRELDADPADRGHLARFNQGTRVRCPGCGHFFTALSGTFFAGRHITYREIVLLLLLLGLDAPNRDIASLLGQSQETARTWRRRFQAQQIAAATAEDTP